MPAEVLATVIVAALALIGTSVTAFFQYKATIQQKKNSEQQAIEKRAESAEKTLENERSQKAREELKKDLEDLSKEVNKVHEEVTHIGERIDKFKSQTEARLEKHDEDIRKLIEAISHNARMYSGLLKMHSKAESRISALAEMSSNNMKFANETASMLHMISNIVATAISSTPDEAAKIRDAVNASTELQRQFVEKILTNQQAFFKSAETDSHMMDDIEFAGENATSKFSGKTN